MDFETWCDKWGVPHAARAELQHQHISNIAPTGVTKGGESAVQAQARLNAAKEGTLLMRNNVGALLDARGVPVRYGLLNDSKVVNAKIKSSDLIGIRKVLIGPSHVGTTIGQFVAHECKAPGWTYKGDAHEKAQLEFLNLIGRYGGYAKFVA